MFSHPFGERMRVVPVAPTIGLGNHEKYGRPQRELAQAGHELEQVQKFHWREQSWLDWLQVDG